MLEIDPGVIEDDVADLDNAMLQTDWAQLGACGKHKELRFSHDACEAWETPHAHLRVVS